MQTSDHFTGNLLEHPALNRPRGVTTLPLKPERPTKPHDGYGMFHFLSTKEHYNKCHVSGEIACAECRRLKIRCDRIIPCSTCVKRGCTALCPNGSSLVSLEIGVNDHCLLKVRYRQEKAVGGRYICHITFYPDF
jgi:Fungal Zn(2)-Cys(6) binuclear cluster domain